MARLFDKDDRSQTVSVRAMRNQKAREANKNKMIKTADGKIFSNYHTYKQSITNERITQPSVERPVNNNGSSLNTRSTISEVFKQYREERAQKREKEEENRREELYKSLRGSNEALASHAMQTNNPLLMKRAAMTENLFLEKEGLYTQSYINATDKVLKAFNGEYSYGVSDRDYQEWLERNTHEETIVNENGEEIKVPVLNINAAPPPVGYDKDGNKIDITNEWAYYQQVENVRNKAKTRKEQYEADKVSMYADHTDQDINTYNSNIDAMVGLITGHGLEGYKQFYSQYIIKPLKYGNYSALGLNLLNDIGETLDFLPRHVKAALASQKGVYGADSFLTSEKGASFTNQESWVYSGGKEKQLQLIDLGALSLADPNPRDNVNRDNISQAIKDAGLWNEYLQFSSEYADEKIGRADLKAVGEYIKSVYTTHQNYDADTGSLVADLVVEFASDPTLLVGVGKSIATHSVRKATEGYLTTALSLAGKTLDNIDETTGFTLNSLTKRLTTDLLSKGTDEITKTVADISEILLNKNVFDTHSAQVFSDALIRNTQKLADTKAFTVVKSIHYADRMANLVDSTMLKTVFAAPYLTYKTVVPVTKRVFPAVADKGTIAFNVFKNLMKSRVEEGIIDEASDTCAIVDADELFNRLKTEHFAQEHQEVFGEYYEKVRRGVEHNCNHIDSIITTDWDTAIEMDNAISTYIHEVTKGQYSDFAGYVDHIEYLVEEYPTLQDTLDLAQRQFDKYTEHKSLLEQGLKFKYKKPSVSGKPAKLPLVKEDKLIDKSERLSGHLKKTWSKLAQKYGEHLSETSPHKGFLNAHRKEVPTIKEAQTQLTLILNKLAFSNLQNSEIYKDFIKLYDDLIQTKLSVDVLENLQFNIFQKDKFVAFEEAVSDKYFKQVLDMFTDPTTGPGQFMREYLDGTHLIEDEWLGSHIDEIIEQIKSLDAFQTLRRKLELDSNPITEDQKYRLLDTLFNRDWVNPHNLTDISSKEMDTFITKINTGLAALDDVESFSLDNFRKIAGDFNNKVWGKYASELKDPAIQTRVQKLLSGGHEDPIDDVRVQILQVILRDPDAIVKYNNMNKLQDVLFYDIETLGLNKDAHDITSIAMKEWEELPDDATLDQILTYIEKEGTSYQVATPEAVLREVVSTSVLKTAYKNYAHIAKDRESMLQEYFKRYSAEVNGKVITVEQMLNDVMRDLDTSFIKRKGQAPVLISHNNNNFDMAFVERQMIKHKVFPAHHKNLDEFVYKEQNTYKMLRSQYPESSLSAEQELYIRRVVADYARTVASFSTSMRVFEPGKLVQSIKACLGDSSSHSKSWDRMVTELSELKVDEIQDSFLTKLKEDKVMFGLDPFHRTVASLSDTEIIKHFGQQRLLDVRAMADEDFQKIWLKEVYGRDVEGSDSLMRLIYDSNPVDKVPKWGYRNIKVNDVSNYFDIIGQRIPQSALIRMNSFSKACGRDVTTRLQSNHLLLGHLAEFRNVIEYVKSFAEQLDVYDDLYFLKYVQAPESVEEAYMVAQKLWDTFMATTKYEGAMYHINNKTPYNDIPEELKGLVSALLRFGDSFDITKTVSEDVRAILTDRNGYYHCQIFKDITNEEVYYISQISEDEHVAKALINKCKQDEHTLKTMSLITEGNNATRAKDTMLAHVLRKSREAIEHYLNLDKKAQTVFKTECLTALRKMMDAQTAQIMGVISTSQHNLISHLLFHNNVLVIPTKGNELHLSQLNDLNKLLSEDSDILYHTVDNQGYLWVGIKKEWQNRIEVKDDAAHVTSDTQMSFFGKPEVYTAPRYGRIVMPQEALSDKTMSSYFIDVEDKVFELSRGASSGSLGLSHTMSKQRSLFENAPQAFLDNTLDLEFTCNERFWHNANYDMSLLGGYDERWKVGSQNDVDYLIATRQALEETAKKTQAERLFIQGIFGAQECLRVQDVFTESMSDKDIAMAFKENDEMVCVRLTESNTTESGFLVEAIDTTTTHGVQMARQSEAIVISYSMYSTLGDVINQSKGYTGFLKLYSKLVHLYKVGYLVSPGIWIRNFVDGTMKAIGDTGDPTGLLQNYISAAQMLRNYKKASNVISQLRGASHNTLIDIERTWDAYNFNMSFQEYKFMDEWMNYDESGGESAVLKLVKEHRAKRNGIDKLAQEANDGKNLVVDSLVKFELLSEDDVRKLFRKYKISNQVKLSEDEFADIFAKRVVPNDALRLEYESIAQLLMKEQPTYKKDFGSVYQTINDKLLSPMSAIEEMVRLGEFMTLEQQGFTKGQIFKKITASQFNYNLKTPTARKLELVIPFYTFMHENMLYWCKQVAENPRMLRYIEKIWGELSWDTSEYGAEDLVYNYSLQSAMLNGNIPLADTGFMFKLAPSFLDAFKIAYNPLERLYSSLFQPIQNVVQDTVRGSDARLLFGEQVFWNDNKNIVEVFKELGTSQTPGFDIMKEMPVIGPFIERYFEFGPQYAERLPDGVPVQEFLVKQFPGVFGVIKNYSNPKPSQTDDLDWDELCQKMAYQGKHWDANQQKFVSMTQYIPGGLNKVYDFDVEGAWEEYCEYRKYYLGEVWDNNLREFVLPENKTIGGLNDPDASWEEVMYYNARLGLFWNSEEGKFVDINDWPLEDQIVLRHTFFGEAYDEETKAWIQVLNPMEGFGSIIEVTSSKVSDEQKSFLERIGMIATVFAEDPNTVRLLVRTPSKYFEATQEDLNKFMQIMTKIGMYEYKNYTKYEKERKPAVPYRSYLRNNVRTFHSYSNIPNFAKSKTSYAKYSYAKRSKTWSDDPAYDTFYSFSYKYRNPQRGVADFPQTKLGIQRYMRLRTDALTRRMRLRAEYNIDNIYSLREVTPKNRLQSIKLHWWMR